MRDFRINFHKQENVFSFYVFAIIWFCNCNLRKIKFPFFKVICYVKYIYGYSLPLKILRIAGYWPLESPVIVTNMLVFLSREIILGIHRRKCRS